MRTFRSWGLLVTLAAIVGAASAWAGETTSKSTRRKLPARSSWRQKTVWDKVGEIVDGDDKKPVEKKPADKKAASKKAEAKTDKEAPAKPVAAKGPEDERDREEEAFLRRSAACLKLQEIAVRTNDQELLKRAEQLSERAWATYAQKSGGLTPADDQYLDKFAGSGKGAKPAKEEKP